jgi:dihydrofolate synthase/folylpolyglutamate synthase
MSDKDIEGVIRPMLGIVDYWHCVDLPLPRAASASQIQQTLEHLGVKNTKETGIDTFAEPALAYEKTLESVGQNDRIVVFGSFLTVSAVMGLRNLKKH